MDIWTLLLDVVVLLLACLVAGGIVARFGQSPLLGYLVAGMLVGGPGSIGVVRLEQEIQTIAELGVSLLLFSLGLEFSWKRLAGLGRTSLLAGIIQIVITAVAAAIVCIVLRLPAREAVAVGAMVALSSTACVLRTLAERGQLDSVHGRDALAILLVQDMAVVPLAILLAFLGGGNSIEALTWSLARTVGLAALLVVGLYVALNIVAVRVLDQFMLERNRELTVLLAVATGLGAAWAAHAGGLSPALGAFIAGLFLGGSPFATQIRADVASFRVILLTLFFGAAGMVADPLWMLRHAPLVVAVAAGIVAGKTALIWLTFRIIGRPSGAGISAGVSLAQIGEFAFVLGSIGVAGGVVSAATNQTIVSAAIVTLFLTPMLVPVAPRIGAAVGRLLGSSVAPEAETDKDDAASAPDVFIIGFGPAGQHVGHALRDRGERVCVIDLNPRSIRAAAAFGFRTYVGDAASPDVLDHVHVDRARLVVITVPDQQATTTILAQIRRLAPESIRIARCRYDLHAPEIEAAGASAVARDEQEVGRRLAEQAAELLARASAPSTPADT